MPSYYNIDDILAEEEILPCTALFEFRYLGHLDPDYKPPMKSKNNSNNNKTTANSIKSLSESTKVKMPLWSVEKWAKLGFARLSIPKHFSRKARERLASDPGAADLRTKNERYFKSGLCLVNLLHECTNVLPAKALTSNKARRRLHSTAIQETIQEASELRQSLLITFTSERLRRIFDWTLGSSSLTRHEEQDDVSLFTQRLTEMEIDLFAKGSNAVSAHQEWKSIGSRRIPVSHVLRTTQTQSSGSILTSTSTGVVRSSMSGGAKEDDKQSNKRQRVL